MTLTARLIEAADLRKTTLKANSRADLIRMAKFMRDYPVYFRAQVLAKVYSADLMRMRSPFFSALLFRFFGKLVGEPYYLRVFKALGAEEIRNCWFQTIDHMVDGRDTEDKDSVGGWSQREFETFQKIMSNYSSMHRED